MRSSDLAGHGLIGGGLSVIGHAKCFRDALAEAGANFFGVAVLLAQVVIFVALHGAIFGDGLVAGAVGASRREHRERRCGDKSDDAHSGAFPVVSPGGYRKPQPG